MNLDHLSPRSREAVATFEQDLANDDLELDNGSTHSGDKPATAEAEDGVWVRCRAWIQMPEEEIEECQT